jgi:hypothetical protein
MVKATFMGIATALAIASGWLTLFFWANSSLRQGKRDQSATTVLTDG